MTLFLPYTYVVRPRLFVFGLLLALIWANVPARPAAAAETGASHQFEAATAPGSTPLGAALLVRFRANASESERSAALSSVGGTIVGTIADLGVTRVAAAPGVANASSLAVTIGAYAAVEWAEADSRVSLALTPNDPYYLTDPLSGLGQWGIRKIAADRAWDVIRGSPAVVVAVIDTGIDRAHPDLAASVFGGTTFNSLPSVGCARSTQDDNGHGTHVAGIIGASGNNSAGIAGVAFGVRLMPIKALDCQGSGVVGDIAAAVAYAVSNGAQIVNVSLGSPSDSPTLRSAMQLAATRGVLVVAAAGNCGIGGGSCDTANETSYPAAYPQVLAVAATDTNDARAVFSTAAPYVGISAPGRSIISTSPTYSTTLTALGLRPNYAVFSGTSQATPFVAGAAALVLSRNPSLTAAQLSERLTSTADHLGTVGTNQQFGAGRVNAFAAVSASAPPPVVVGPTYGATYDTASVPRTASKGATTAMTVRLTNSSSFTWSSTGSQPVMLSYHWMDPTGNTVIWDGLRTPLIADVPVGQSATIAATVAAPTVVGSYQLRFDLVREGVSWFSGQAVSPGTIAVTVNSGYGATYVVSGTTSSVIFLGTPFVVPVGIANSGTRAWPSAGPNPVRLSYHWVRLDGSVVVWEGQRAALTSDIAPGASATVSLNVSPPPTPGIYSLRIDLVQEGLTWFSGEGVVPLAIPFAVDVR